MLYPLSYGGNTDHHTATPRGPSLRACGAVRLTVMSVYIDPPRWPAHGTEFSHLISDTSLAELHDAAQRIGLSSRAFDRDHYDVPKERYDDAVAAGAREVDGKKLVRLLVTSGLRIPAARRNEKVLSALRHRWDHAVGHSEPLQQVRETLLAAWGQPHRTYHDRTHLLAVLTALDALTDKHAPLETVLAAWFHDAIHTGQTGKDEEESAQLALDTLPDAGVEPSVAEEVARLVRLTVHHRPEPEDVHGALLSDADLAILGAPPERYAEYVRQVRAEYAQIPKHDFAHARLTILKSLDPQELFHTERGRTLWQEQAQENLAVEIDELQLAALNNLHVPEQHTVLPIAGLCYITNGKLLTVRKQGTSMFMLVGGKCESEESPLNAVLREAQEEVGLELGPGDVRLLGRFHSPAANEPDTWIDSTVFLTDVLDGDHQDSEAQRHPTALAEIDELHELDLHPHTVREVEENLAPLLRRQVLPLLRRRDRRFWSAYCGPLGPYEVQR